MRRLRNVKIVVAMLMMSPSDLCCLSPAQPGFLLIWPGADFCRAVSDLIERDRPMSDVSYIRMRHA